VTKQSILSDPTRAPDESTWPGIAPLPCMHLHRIRRAGDETMTLPSRHSTRSSTRSWKPALGTRKCLVYALSPTRALARVSRCCATGRYDSFPIADQLVIVVGQIQVRVLAPISARVTIEIRRRGDRKRAFKHLELIDDRFGFEGIKTPYENVGESCNLEGNSLMLDRPSCDPFPDRE